MICPQCEQEFPWHVMTCPDCGVDTVDRLPGPQPEPDMQLVNVFKTGDAAAIAVAKSVLEAEGIDHFVRGDGLQDLFGFGRLASFSLTGPAEFWVRAGDEARARELLAELSDEPGKSGVPIALGARRAFRGLR